METEGDKRYTAEQITELRKSGADRPEGVKTTEWAAPMTLNSLHKYMCHMAASGMSQGKIAEETGITPGRVSIILNSELAVKYVEGLQMEMYGKNHMKRFQGLVNKAIGVLDEIMDGRGAGAGAKPATKLNAAAEILDRALGKAKQQIEVRDTSLSGFYEKLEQMMADRKTLPAVPAADKEGLDKSGNGDIMEADYREVQPAKSPEEAELDKVDQWFEDMYGKPKA